MLFFFFKQKTAYEMRISDWSSDVCSSDLEIEKFRAQEYWSVEADFRTRERRSFTARLTQLDGRKLDRLDLGDEGAAKAAVAAVEAGDFEIGEVEKKRVRRNPQPPFTTRSEEHTSELQSLMRISYAVFCLKKKNKKRHIHNILNRTKTSNITTM